MDPTCQYDTRIPRIILAGQRGFGAKGSTANKGAENPCQVIPRRPARRLMSAMASIKWRLFCRPDASGQRPHCVDSVSVPRRVPGRNLLSLLGSVGSRLAVGSPGGGGAVPRCFKPWIGFDKLTMAVGFLHCPKKHDSLVAAWQPWHRLPSRLVLEVDNHQVMGGSGEEGEEVRDGVGERVSGCGDPFQASFCEPAETECGSVWVGGRWRNAR